MSDLFDDPELQAEMKARGIVHKPGMADKLMQELKPLLAADGIDLDNLDEDVDLNALNAAMARAVERHNMELVTPVGRQRKNALEVLRKAADLIIRGDESEALDVLGQVPIEPSKNRAAVSHVIGLGLGLIDEWQADLALRDALARAYAPKVSQFSRAVARDILNGAKHSSAMAGHQWLLVHYGGRAVFEGVVLAVAGAVNAIAASNEVTADVVSRALLANGTWRPTPKKPKQSVFGNIAGHLNAPAGVPEPSLTLAARTVLRDFKAWLEAQAQIDATSPSEEVKLLRGLFTMALNDGLDLTEPRDIPFFVDFIRDAEADEDGPDEQMILMIIVTLDEYVHFRLEQHADADWDDAHAVLESQLAEASGMPPEFAELTQVMEEAAIVDQAQRRAALASTLVVQAVRPLLEWIGKSRPITGTGALRRADIEPVGAMLGLKLVGSAKRASGSEDFEDEEPDWDFSGLPRQVQTMWEVPTLAAWWEALRLADLIELTASRLKPGPAAAAWLAEETPPTDRAAMLVAVYTGYLLTSNLRPDMGLLNGLGPILTINAVLEALGVNLEGSADLDEIPDFLRQLVLARSEFPLLELERVGLLESTSDAEANLSALQVRQVAELLRGDIARGVAVAMTLAESFDEE